MGLGYRFRATFLTGHMRLGLRLRLPLWKMRVKARNERVTSVSPKDGEYRETGHLAYKKVT